MNECMHACMILYDHHQQASVKEREEIVIVLYGMVWYGIVRLFQKENEY